MAEAKKKRRKPKWIWLRRSILAETLETLKSLIAESEDGSEEERTDARSVMAKLAALIGEKQSHPNWSSADIVTLHRPTTPPAPAVESGEIDLRAILRAAQTRAGGKAFPDYLYGTPPALIVNKEIALDAMQALHDQLRTELDRLQSAPEVTEEMVEKACEVFFNETHTHGNVWQNASGNTERVYRAAMEPALRAALQVKE